MRPTPALSVAAASWDSVLRRRGLAFLLPLLCICSAALLPTLVDLYKLRVREPDASWAEVVRAAVFGLGLESMAAVPVGVALGLLLMVLARGQDLSVRAGSLASAILGGIRRQNRSPGAGAAVYAGLAGIALFVAAGYKINHLFFTSFKNRELAALVLALCVLVLLIAVALMSAALWVGLSRLTALLLRVPVVGLLGTVLGAASLGLLAVGGVAAYLVTRYPAVVRMIDWRPASYPGMVVGGGLLLLCVVLWSRARRMKQARRAGSIRVALLALWAALWPGIWGYGFVALENHPTVRTLLLRRAYGAARSFDLISSALDFDGDGYLSFFGGGDCAPLDAAVHPGAVEIPGNGIDDNCYGGDLSGDRLRSPKRRFDLKLPAPIAGKRPSILLITLDGLRADHVGAYGYSRPTTPNLDRLAKSGVMFDHAITQAPSTRYSIPSFLTSKYWSQVPRKNGDDVPEPVLPEALTMAEVFKAAGYRTGAALSYHVFARSWGLDQGFDFYDLSQAAYYDGKGGPGWNKDQPYVLIDAAKKFLGTQSPDRPYLLWVHFFEPHPPYVRRTFPRDFGADLVATYDGELAFVDGKVGELLDIVRKRADAERTVVIVGADHGREFGEHGAASHGYDLYNQSLHVPLIFAVPGLAPRRIRNPVGLIDVLPTMVSLAGIKEAFDFEGESLLPQIVSGTEPPPDRPIFSEVAVGFHDAHVINSITTRDFKLIYDITLNTYQLYDRRTDLVEKTDVIARKPTEAKRLKLVMQQVREHATVPGIDEEIHSNIVASAPTNPRVKQVTFGGEIEFLGFEVHPERPRAGAILTISWYLKGLKPTRNDNKFIVHLRGSRGAFFDAKHVPVRGQYPTTKWRPGVIIRDQQHMRLPPEPQEWEVWIGFGAGHDILKPSPPLKMLNTTVLVGKFATY